MTEKGLLVKSDAPFKLTEEIAAVLGPQLVVAAREKRAKVIADSMMSCTEDFFRQIEVLEERIDEATKRIADIRLRIQDLEEGKFSLNKENRIIFPHLPPPHIG